jgi:hypothetical protein
VATRPMREDEMDHRLEQDERWARLTTFTCPGCGLSVLVLELPSPSWVWCAQCSTTPRLERVGT